MLDPPASSSLYAMPHAMQTSYSGARLRGSRCSVRASLQEDPVKGIGHRVVHGGMKFNAPIRMNRNLLNTLAQIEPLAPLHQPHNLAAIRAIFDAAPHLAQVACFDTAFHRNQPLVAQSFALPRRFSDAGIRRYGFHGLSYEYLVSRLHDLCPQLASGRVIFAHLGNGASLCAVHQGQSVASTMGFTAVDGLMMGTRCGSLDAGVILYLLREYHMDTAAIEDLIYRQSGLLGVSGISPDMRTLRESSDPAAREAIELFVYRIIRETGSLVSALGLQPTRQWRIMPSMVLKEKAMLRAALPFVAILLAAARAIAQVPSGDATAGQRLVQAQCSTCHDKEDSPRSRQKGPSLMAVAAIPSTTSMSLHAFLMTPHANMPNYQLTPKEIDDVVAYILSLRRHQG